MCALSECTGTVFCIWPDDGSFEPKDVAEILILIAVYIVVLLDGINCYINVLRFVNYATEDDSKCVGYLTKS